MSILVIAKPVAFAIAPGQSIHPFATQAKIKGKCCIGGQPMTVRAPRYSQEEFARRGQELYETQIRSQVETGNEGKIVAIDIETGAYEVAETPISATDQLYEQYPDAQPWVVRIGHRTVYRFGSRSLRP